MLPALSLTSLARVLVLKVKIDSLFFGEREEIVGQAFPLADPKQWQPEAVALQIRIHSPIKR